MAEVNSSAAFTAKRKPDPSPLPEEDESIDKHRKLEPISDQTLQIQKPCPPVEAESQRPRIELPKHEIGEDGLGGGEHSNGNSAEDEEVKKEPLGIEEDKVERSEPPEPEISGDSNAEDDEPAGVDRKGKGISIRDKGKGKLMEEEEEEEESDEDDSSSDDDDDDNISLSGSDSGGDPLEEVDLNNILPSRTRRRVPQPGFYSNSNIPAADDDDDSSDDSDA